MAILNSNLIFILTMLVSLLNEISVDAIKCYHCSNCEKGKTNLDLRDCLAEETYCYVKIIQIVNWQFHCSHF